MTNTWETPERVQELAAACVRFVQNAVGIAPDFTPETLPLLDHYARDVADRPSAEILDLLAPMCGAYFGEVIRRSFEGVRWHAPDEDYASWRIEFETCFLHFNPIGIAVEVLTRGDADGWSAHLQVLDHDRAAVQEALGRMGAVESDDYYRFSLRAEVIEQVSSLLVARAVAAGESHRRFGPEIYRAAVSSPPEGRVLH